MKALEFIEKQIDELNTKSIALDTSELEQSAKLIVETLIQAGLAGDELIEVINILGKNSKYPEAFKEAAHYAKYIAEKQLVASQEIKESTKNQKEYAKQSSISLGNIEGTVKSLRFLREELLLINQVGDKTSTVFTNFKNEMGSALDILTKIEKKLDALDGRTVTSTVVIKEVDG